MTNQQALMLQIGDHVYDTVNRSVHQLEHEPWQGGTGHVYIYCRRIAVHHRKPMKFWVLCKNEDVRFRSVDTLTRATQEQLEEIQAVEHSFKKTYPRKEVHP